MIGFACLNVRQLLAFNLKNSHSEIHAMQIVLPTNYTYLIGLFFLGLIVVAVLAFLIRYTSSKRKRFLDLVFRTSTRGIILVDHRGRVKMSNAAFLRMIGHEDRVGKNMRFKDLVAKPGFEIIFDLYNNFYWLREVYEKRNINLGLADNAREYQLEISKVRFGLQQHPLSLISLTDFTEFSDLKKMQAWAAMAKRVAHEIKSPLSTVLLSAQRLQMAYQDSDARFQDKEKYFNLIIEEIKNVREIVNNFQRFANIEPLHLVPRNVKEVILKLLDKIKNRIPSGIAVEKDFGDEDLTAQIDEREFHEALANLFNNSFTAMKGEGILTITTMDATQMPKIVDGKPRPSVIIEISDNGVGIPADDLPKIYQPDYTTFQGGTGLGLAIVQRVINDHNGFIEVQSTPKVGTTFRIYLP